MDERVVGYAAAIIELARAEGQLERVESELFTIAETFEATSELRSALTDPKLPLERKQSIVDELLGSRASTLTVGLVQFLVGQGFSTQLPAVARAVVEGAARTRDKAVAEVRSAVPLDDETVERLVRGLERATGKSVEVKAIVDPAVLGGIVARVGDTVIDGSVAGRLGSLRQELQRR